MATQGRSDRGAGRVGLVTGGASGIGAAIGRWLARHGTDVVLCDVDGAGARAVADEINDGTDSDEGGGGAGRARGVGLDVTDGAALEAVVGTVEAEHGRLDYLFANAGIAGPVALEETGYEDWRSVIDVNVNGVFFAAKAALPLLAAGENPGHLVVTASVSGRKPKPIMLPYRTSKAAVLMLTHCLAIRAAPEVRVNALCPGRVETPLVADLYERRAREQDTTAEELRAAEERDLPLGRTADHEDILGLLDYLLFGDAFLTGQEFYLDGGGYQAL